jgi:hypothetical protein
MTTSAQYFIMFSITSAFSGSAAHPQEGEPIFAGSVDFAVDPENSLTCTRLQISGFSRDDRSDHDIV